MQYGVVLIICLLLGFASKMLDVVFNKLEHHHVNKEVKSAGSRALVALAYGINLLLSYTVMLALMTFNVGIFVAIVLSRLIAHSLFSYSDVTFRDVSADLETIND